LSAGRNVLRVDGTTTQIAHAFDASVETVRLRGGVLDAHFASSASLPHAIAKDVSAVAGLSTVAPESTNVTPATSRVAVAGTCPSAGSSTGTTPNSVGGYTVQQQAALYGLNAEWTAGNTGVGQTIGVYELATYDASDMNTYDTCYGLAPTITSINVDGGPTNSDNADNAPDEATLDVEETAALAPGAAIEVYQGTQNGSGPTDIYSEIASQDTATIVTTSWGICEADTDGAAYVEQPIFEEMAAQGQTLVAAAGDDGSSDCEGVQGGSTSALAVDDPASQPYVTGVGGLAVNSISPLNESVWNDQCTSANCGAGGGGISTLWSRPNWQNAAGIATSQTMRLVPDLSVMGDPSTGFIQYYTGAGSGFCQHSCSGGWGAIGGTSIGAPLVSSLIAVAAQACGTSRLGFVNPSLYAMAATGYADVTSGNNNLFNVGQYSATAGFDEASGLGSPDGAAFFSGLCPSTYSQSESSFAVTSTTGVINTAGPTISATLRNAAGDPLANSDVDVTATAPAGPLSIDSVNGASTSPGEDSGTIASSAGGVVSFTVGSSVAQNVVVTITYNAQTIYSTTLTFKATAAISAPGAPSISKLAALKGGFALIVKPPNSTGGSVITYYQYSINGGKTWKALAKGSRSINVVKLAQGHAYRVYTRALNAVGASLPSLSKVVVTKT
jgi:subtilase family serine protease